MAVNESRGDRVIGGFTLIELLVAMALSALVATMFYQAMRIGRLSWTFVRTKTEANEDVFVAQRLLRSLIHGMRFAEPYERRGIRIGAIHGDPESLVFSSLLESVPYERGLYRFKLSFDRPARALEVEYSRDAEGWDDPGESRNMVQTVLLAGIKELHLSYLSREEAPRWRSAWPASARPPAAIRIKILFDDEDPRIWPPLVARPMATAPVHCNFDPVSRECR